VIRKHIEAEDSDIDRLEGIGAVNFLALDDIKVTQEGEHIDPESIITLPTKEDNPFSLNLNDRQTIHFY